MSIIRVSQLGKRAVLIEFTDKGWSWAEFAGATEIAYTLVQQLGQGTKLVSDLERSGSYLPGGDTAFTAGRRALKDLPSEVDTWLIVGGFGVQTVLNVFKRLYSKSRLIGVESMEEAHRMIADDEDQA